MRKVSEILDAQARLVLIVTGLLLVLAGNTFDYHILKIDVAQLLVHIGALLLIVGLLHWIFDTTMRRQLTQEIFDSVLGAGRISSSGIIDVNHSSRNVDYTKLIASSKQLTIGEHYSSRLFEDYAPQIRERLSRERQTTLILLKEDSPAAQYLRESGSGHGDISGRIRAIREILAGAGKNTTSARIRWHKRVLRYSFVMTEDVVWVRFFTNSSGFSLVPAVCIAKGTPLYEFFLTDVTRLLEESDDDDPA